MHKFCYCINAPIYAHGIYLIVNYGTASADENIFLRAVSPTEVLLIGLLFNGSIGIGIGNTFHKYCSHL